MRRLTLVTALLAAIVGASPASAAILTQAGAYGAAGAYAQRAAAVSGWATRTGATCARQTPWRFWCRVDLSSYVRFAPVCSQTFDVVSPFFGTRLRYEDFGAWDCY